MYCEDFSNCFGIIKINGENVIDFIVVGREVVGNIDWVVCIGIIKKCG